MSGQLAILSVAIRRDEHLLLVRQRSRQISQFLGFSVGDTARITTAISEVARNAIEYGGGGTAAFAINGNGHDRQDLVVRVADDGAGIDDLAAILSPSFKSRTGMGIGIKGARALMDRFEITSSAGHGTTVVMSKSLPRSMTRFGPADAARLSDDLAKASETTPFAELQLQNHALLNTLHELAGRQAEIERLGAIAADARDRAEAAQLVAERSLVVRNRFMALTTHELRTPLSAIVGYLELLDMEFGASMSGRQKGYHARVQRACGHLLGITNDFLDMAQGDAGRLRITRQSGPARNVMNEAASLVAPQAAARNVSLRLSEGTKGINYLGDANRVRQVLVNILGNAVSFTPSGGRVDLTATCHSESPTGSALTTGPWCVIRVADMGPGIPVAKLNQVFEPFEQLPSESPATRGGNGLGLTVSRQLALLMGGDLIAESSDAGAMFSLWLAEGSCGEESEHTNGLAPTDGTGSATA